MQNRLWGLLIKGLIVLSTVQFSSDYEEFEIWRVFLNLKRKYSHIKCRAKTKGLCFLNKLMTWWWRWWEGTGNALKKPKCGVFYRKPKVCINIYNSTGDESTRAILVWCINMCFSHTTNVLYIYKRKVRTSLLESNRVWSVFLFPVIKTFFRRIHSQNNSSFDGPW